MAGRTVSLTADPDGDAAFLQKLVGCRLCEGQLDHEDDDKPNGLCWSCKDRPEAARLKVLPRTAPSNDRRLAANASEATLGHRPAPAAPRPLRVRPEFTVADKSLIQRLGPVLPVGDLLRLLNERLEANTPEALPYTLEQLQAALPTALPSGNDWAAVRKLLTHARASGLLSTITPQVIDDFAVVFSCTPAQVLRLKDVLMRAKESR